MNMRAADLGRGIGQTRLGSLARGTVEVGISAADWTKGVFTSDRSKALGRSVAKTLKVMEAVDMPSIIGHISGVEQARGFGRLMDEAGLNGHLATHSL